MITKLRGPEYIMHRHEANPIISIEDFPVPANAVFNCGQTMYEGKTILLIAAFYKGRVNGSTTGIHLATSEDSINFEISPEPFVAKKQWYDFPLDCDRWVIDPRITKIDDTYYIVRPAQFISGPAAVLEKTKDFKTLEFVECISIPSNRVPCLFPEKINGEYVRIDRPYNYVELEDLANGEIKNRYLASMWISYSPDMIYWGKHRPLLYTPLSYANYKIGPTPPIKTKDGWLVIIHGVYSENQEFCYSLGAMLLDLEDPTKIVGCLDRWILTPMEDYEVYGRVENVVFACGAIADEEKDEIRIYYGAADTCIGLATGSLSELIEATKNSKAGQGNFVEK